MAPLGRLGFFYVVRRIVGTIFVNTVIEIRKWISARIASRYFRRVHVGRETADEVFVLFWSLLRLWPVVDFLRRIFLTKISTIVDQIGTGDVTRVNAYWIYGVDRIIY